jgi:hypothetical protein
VILVTQYGTCTWQHVHNLSGRPMFHHGSNMWTSHIFQIDSFRHRLRHEDDRYQRSIRILYVFILFNICSLDASESTRVYRWWSHISYHSWVSCWEAGTFCTSIPCLFQRKGHHPIQNVYHSNAYATRMYSSTLDFREYLLMFFRTYLRTLPVLHVPFYHQTDTHCLSLSSTLLPSLVDIQS